MVGWLAVPSMPIAVGVPPTLLTTRTAAAPAFCAFRILVENVHVPRETRAILPVSEEAASALQARLSEVPESTTPSGAVSSVVTVAKSPEAAPMEGFPVTVTGVPTKCGTVLAPAPRARAADPGDSTVKWPGPEFPAATAKTMLAWSRLADGNVKRSWEAGAPAPRLMLPASKPAA